MERFLPILTIIQTRLREILTRNEGYFLSWDIGKLRGVGGAGLGIIDRANIVQKRHLEEADKEYFRSVHDTLGNICRKIETGEYFKALLGVAAKREREYHDSRA
jgi:hypothetical protein